MRKLWILALILLLLTLVGHQDISTSDSPLESPMQTVQASPEKMALVDAEVPVESTTVPPEKQFPDAVEQTPESPEPSLPDGEVVVPTQTPESVQAPQTEDSVIRRDGEIYVPGFGWIPDSGEENVCIIAPHAGKGEIVGEM